MKENLKAIAQMFTPGWLTFYVIASVLVPIVGYDFDIEKQFTEKYQFGTVHITSFNKGEWSENLYTMKMTGSSTHKYAVVVNCDEDTTIITGYSNRRAPDSQNATYMCKAGESLGIEAHGGWITLAANGTAKKLGMRSYNVDPSSHHYQP